MNVSKQKGTLSVLNFHYLAGTSEGVQHYTERHELGLFSIEEMFNAFKKSGLPAFYRSAIEDKNSQLLLVHDDKSGNTAGMALGRK